MKLDTKVFEEKMQKAIAALQGELSTIRAGKASPTILDRIDVDYYGVPTKINAMAVIKAADAHTLEIAPWDPSTLKEIEKAILASDLGLTPQNDGKIIRLIFPALTEERRKALTKDVLKIAEESKVAIRNIRRDANDKAKDMKKNSEMTEDEQKSSEKSVQDLTDKYIKQIDSIADDKNKEVLSI